VPHDLEFGIRSAGIAEMLEQMQKDAPKPPGRMQMVRWDSEVGRALNVPRGTSKPYYMGDLLDEEYLAKVEAHNRKTMFATINRALVVNLVDKEGRPVQATFVDKEGRPVQATDALQTMGLTLGHFQAINLAIERLTQREEEDREDFSGRRSMSAATPSVPTT
ncbi:MAG: hypothetical protein Q8S13_10500, partial [Dehalococcoidia bacterium]|nr:hypothetical protein [Dehalococcoidia bacterium]